MLIDAPRRRVWHALEDIGSHVDWMREAKAITFTSARRRGVGATFVCDTRVGPLRTADVMEVVRWRPSREMAIRHEGIVSGTGRFLLRRRRGGRTRFVWSERLRFPWWAGGPVGGLVAGRVLAAIWRRNLRQFKRVVEGS